MVVGCLTAGKLYLKSNEHLFIGGSLLLMGSCLYVAPFCGSLWTLVVTMVLQGFFSGFFTVGKTWYDF